MPKFFFSAFNPRLKKRRKTDEPQEETEIEEPSHSKIDIFGKNPDWEPGWVQAYKINVAGQVSTNQEELPAFKIYYLDWTTCGVLPVQHRLLVNCSVSLF